MESNIQKSSVATQTDVIQKDFISTKILSSFYRETEGFPQFLYKSHTLTQMGVLLIVIYYIAVNFQATTMADSALRGFFLSCLALIVFATIYFPTPLLQRPHPAFWRMLQGWGCCYLMAVIFCLMFTHKQFMEFLSTFIDSELGKPLPEKSYGENCEFSLINVYGALDVFATAHVLGWMVKMWILRDIKLAFFQSVFFEYLEITFRHWLPNFHECWWDHVILDIIICNSAGIILAYYLMKKFSMKEYSWNLRSQEKKRSFFQNVKDLFLTPNIEKHQWQVFSSPKRFLSVLWFIIFQNACDLSYFFNKYILWINPNHHIMKFRMFPFAFLSILGARDYYTYISDDNVTRMGPSGWLIQMIIFSEWLLFFKNYDGQFTEIFPLHVKITWFIIGSIILLILIFLIIKEKKKFKPQIHQD